MSREELEKYDDFRSREKFTKEMSENASIEYCIDKINRLKHMMEEAAYTDSFSTNDIINFVFETYTQGLIDGTD